MKRRTFLRLAPGALLLAPEGRAQLEELLAIGEQILAERFDPGFLDALKAGNLAEITEHLNRAVELFESEYVLDLAAVGNTIKTILPLLDSQPELQPYAAWLRARADYFDVARSLQDAAPRSPDTPRPVPTPDQQRKEWRRTMESRERPAGAQHWVPQLKPIFRNAGAPPELVWLAEIESAFNPAARSPVGAAGLFQLMPATAQELGLRLQPQDERLDPERNARAAATYLRRIYDQFRDWPLTLAAYNAGPGRIRRTMNRQGARSFDVIAPALPAETQMYVPKFESVLRKREGVELTALPVPA